MTPKLNISTANKDVTKIVEHDSFIMESVQNTFKIVESRNGTATFTGAAGNKTLAIDHHQKNPSCFLLYVWFPDNYATLVIDATSDQHNYADGAGHYASASYINNGQIIANIYKGDTNDLTIGYKYYIFEPPLP